MNQDLAEILKKKQKETGADINWDERRDKYLAAVDDVYDKVESILAEPIAENAVSIHRRPKQLFENYIGSYQADDLVLVIGDEQVRFSPRGRNIVGAIGRIDVIGERAEVNLILREGSPWGFVEARQPELRVVPFDESTFAEVLRIVMRG